MTLKASSGGRVWAGRAIRPWLLVGVAVLMTLYGWSIVLHTAQHSHHDTAGARGEVTQARDGGVMSGVQEEGGQAGRGDGCVQPCPPTPPDLMGKLHIDTNVTLSAAERRVAGVVQPGGTWRPQACVPRWSVAVIVPFRDRHDQLGAFLQHMHPFLQRQQLHYTIYIIEQNGTAPFNRARLLNVGFVEASLQRPWDCYAFHDIDLLPEDDRHLYHCSGQPRHLAVAASNNKYRSSDSLQRNTYFGGACLMGAGHMEQVNGWSNEYWGWGGEDDDMWRRLRFEDLPVWRYSSAVARYTALPHKAPLVNQRRYEVLQRNTGRYQRDGLNTLHYRVHARANTPLYTHLLVDVGQPSSLGV